MSYILEKIYLIDPFFYGLSSALTCSLTQCQCNLFSMERLKPLFSAIDTFLRKVSTPTRRAPHIRDALDIKRVMILVVSALIPCILVAIWNTGMQSFVYSEGHQELMNAYFQASASWSGYWHFATLHWRPILTQGLTIFLPIVFISYAVGGFWEAVFAVVRKTEIAEGFLVTGILYALILPPTIPYWMVALGVSFGVIISKELFGGTGMNILNPALTCRCFLYFAFPAYMTGSIWSGQMIDAYSQPSALAVFNVSNDIKRVHVDAIASNQLHEQVATSTFLQDAVQKWGGVSLETLNPEKLEQFVTASNGLGLSQEGFVSAQKFVELKYGLGLFSDANLFFGNKVGSLGEVSILACLLGAAFLLIVRIASWRTMLAVIIGATITALLFEYGARSDPWNPANFDFPAYKHFLLGGLAFGLVFMATDPVSSPTMKGAQWAYGILIGMLTIIIRTINPAYPEGIMLAILFGNVFAPLFDQAALRLYRRPRAPIQ